MDLPQNQRLRACLGRPGSGAGGPVPRQVYEELLAAKLIVPVQEPPKGNAVHLMFTQTGGRTGLPVFTNPDDMARALPQGMQVAAFDAKTVFHLAEAAQPRIDSILIDPCGAQLTLERETFKALASGVIPGTPVPAPRAPALPESPAAAGRCLPMPQVAGEILSALVSACEVRKEIDSCWLFCLEKGGTIRRTIGFEVSGSHGSECVNDFMALGPVRRALVRCGVTDALIIAGATLSQVEAAATEVFRRRKAAPDRPPSSGRPSSAGRPAPSGPRFLAPAACLPQDLLAGLAKAAAPYGGVKACWLFRTDLGRGLSLAMGFDASGRDGVAQARTFWELPAVREATERLGVEEVMVLETEDLPLVKAAGVKVFQRGWFWL
ncbi:MAG: SseB family protein [Elusimicrobiota bacterium]|jgi:hypothetical protein